MTTKGSQHFFGAKVVAAVMLSSTKTGRVASPRPAVTADWKDFFLLLVAALIGEAVRDFIDEGCGHDGGREVPHVLEVFRDAMIRPTYVELTEVYIIFFHSSSL